jgi:hypothetical protein
VVLVVAGAALTAVATAVLTSSWLKPAIAAALIALVSALLAPWATSAAQGWLSQRERVIKQKEAGSDAEVRSPQEEGRRFPRVGNVGLDILGVNPAIPATQDSADPAGSLVRKTFPPYVLRDLDETLRAAMRGVREADGGGLFVLVGAPLSGKTRTAGEAIREILPDWNLFFPDSAGDLELVIESRRSFRNTVIWLDELDKYLEGEHSLQPGSVRRLISSGVGAILIGTLWPGQFEKLKLRPPLEMSTDIAEDNVAAQRRILRMAHVFTVSTRLSEGERARAEALGLKDKRIRQALASGQYSFTQVLGAAPDLIHHWREADPYAKAVLDASVDLRRAGYSQPIPRDLLEQVAGTLMPDSAKAAARADWFDSALEYATRTLQGVVRALIPVGSQVSATDGYAVADFLQEEAIRERDRLPIPAGVWDALQGSDLQPSELLRLGLSARARLKLDYAEDFLLKAFRASPESSWHQLIALYEQQGRSAETEQILRAAVARGLPGSYERLAVLYQRLGQPQKLIQVLADAQRSGKVESLWLLRSLVLRSQIQSEAEEVYRSAADSGLRGAWQVLVYFLMSEGRAQEAREIIDEADARGDADAWWGLATLPSNTPEEFEYLLRAAVEGRKPGAWIELANLLVATGRSSEAIELLVQAVNEGQPGAAEELIETLEELGREDEARMLRTKGMKAWMAAGSEPS